MGAHMDETLRQLRAKTGGDMSNEHALRVAKEEFLRSRDGFNLDADSDPVSSSVNQGIDATLDERGKRYGSYTEKAAIIQQMKESMRAGSSWAGMDPDMKESLEMVVHKIGRIVTGDASYLDSWIDIEGYTKLVSGRLQGVAR